MLGNGNRSQPLFLLAAWLIALIASITSLYLSEVLNWQVCTLCWYQRLGIYPLAIILGIALYKEDTQIFSYALPFTIITLFFSLYQYLEQMIPGFGPIHFCTASISGMADCSKIDWSLFNFITLPLLSFICSILIFILLLFSRK